MRLVQQVGGQSLDRRRTLYFLILVAFASLNNPYCIHLQSEGIRTKEVEVLIHQRENSKLWEMRMGFG